MLRKVLLSAIVTIMTLSVNAQFKVLSNGEITHITGRPGPWDNLFTTTAMNNYSKAYILRKGGSTTFYVTGNGQVWSKGYLTISDERFKKDIEDFSSFEGLYNLKAKKYKYKGDDNDSIKTNNSNKHHLGFLAQDVYKYYPDIVQEDENGYMAVEYTQMIPLLIEAVKSHKTQLDALQAVILMQEQELADLKNTCKGCDCEDKNSKLKSASSDEDILTDSEQAALFNNAPNPFSEGTEIKFNIPSNYSTAKLIIHDMQGLEVLSFNIQQAGEGGIRIEGSDLRPGMFLYTLVVDNQIVDTKRMLLVTE